MNGFGERDKIKIGAWWCVCCLLDLARIDTDEEAEEVRELWDDGLLCGAWETREAAITDLGPTQHPDELADALNRLKDHYGP